MGAAKVSSLIAVLISLSAAVQTARHELGYPVRRLERRW